MFSPLLSLVPRVLCHAGESQVCFSIMQAVMVDMVDALAWPGIHNHAVHRYLLIPTAADCNTSCCVVASRGPAQVPFVFGEGFVFFGVDDGAFALC